MMEHFELMLNLGKLCRKSEKKREAQSSGMHDTRRRNVAGTLPRAVDEMNPEVNSVGRATT